MTQKSENMRPLSFSIGRDMIKQPCRASRQPNIARQPALYAHLSGPQQRSAHAEDRTRQNEEPSVARRLVAPQAADVERVSEGTDEEGEPDAELVGEGAACVGRGRRQTWGG